MKDVVWNFYHMFFCNALGFNSGLWPVTRLIYDQKGFVSISNLTYHLDADMTAYEQRVTVEVFIWQP